MSDNERTKWVMADDEDASKDLDYHSDDDDDDDDDDFEGFGQRSYEPLGQKTTPSPSSFLTPTLQVTRIKREKMSFYAAVFGPDPEYEYLIDRIAQEEGTPRDLEEAYVPRHLRVYKVFNGPMVDKIEIPPEGFDEEQVDGVLEEHGWPRQNVQLKVYRHSMYIVSRRFAADPEERSSGDSADDDYDDDDDEGFDDDELKGRSGLDLFLARIASPSGPDYLRQLMAVVGPAVVEIVVMIDRRRAQERLKLQEEHEERLLLLQQKVEVERARLEEEVQPVTLQDY